MKSPSSLLPLPAHAHAWQHRGDTLLDQPWPRHIPQTRACMTPAGSHHRNRSSRPVLCDHYSGHALPQPGARRCMLRPADTGGGGGDGLERASRGIGHRRFTVTPSGMLPLPVRKGKQSMRDAQLPCRESPGGRAPYARRGALPLPCGGWVTPG